MKQSNKTLAQGMDEFQQRPRSREAALRQAAMLRQGRSEEAKGVLPSPSGQRKTKA